MYAGLRISDTLQKKLCLIGPGLCSLQLNFAELHLYALG
jgi:hypothetical protein